MTILNIINEHVARSRAETDIAHKLLLVAEKYPLAKRVGDSECIMDKSVNTTVTMVNVVEGFDGDVLAMPSKLIDDVHVYSDPAIFIVGHVSSGWGNHIPNHDWDLSMKKAHISKAVMGWLSGYFEEEKNREEKMRAEVCGK